MWRSRVRIETSFHHEHSEAQRRAACFSDQNGAMEFAHFERLISLSLALRASVVKLPQMDIFEEIVDLRRAGRRGALATIVNARGSIPSFESARMLVRDDGSISGTIGGGCVEAEVWQAAREVMEQEKPRTLTFNLNHDPKYDTGLVCGGTLEIYLEPILPVQTVYLFGAGHVSVNVYRAARMAGFEVVVVDDRQSYASRERFPEAKDVYAEDFDRALSQLAPNHSSYLVIVTRGHRDDMRVLRWAVDTPAKYIGMIGSQRKVIAIYKQLEKEGVASEKLSRVYAPVGLDIGAITPEEIAIAIVAEMIAIRRGAGSLNHKRSLKAAEILQSTKQTSDKD